MVQCLVAGWGEIRTVLSGIQCRAQRVQNNGRSDWNVLGGIYSCHSCMDTNQQAPVLPWARLPGCMWCLELVRGSFCFRCSPWCLSGRSAGPGNAPITATTTRPGWRGPAQGYCAAVLGRLQLPWELEPMGCDLRMTSQRITPGWRRYFSKQLARAMLQQVHLEASVAVHEDMLEYLTACVHHPPSASILFSTCIYLEH